MVFLLELHPRRPALINNMIMPHSSAAEVSCTAGEGTKRGAMRVTRGEWQGSAAAGASWGDCVRRQTEAEERRSVDKFNQTVSSLTHARLGL